MSEEEQKHVTKAELEALAEAVRKELLSIEKETVSREEFDALKDTLSEMQRQLTELPEMKEKFYKCTREGCGWQTVELGAYFDHMFKEKMRELSQTAPKGHRTVEELVACPECFPKLVSAIEDALTKRGRRGDVCPDCGAELVKPLLAEPYCPKCREKKGSLF